METLSEFLTSDRVWVLVPVSAIVVWGVLAVQKQAHRNQERLAMIEKGMHPDERPARKGSGGERARAANQPSDG